MNTSLFKTVPLSSLTAADIGYRGTDEWTVKRGQEALKKYIVDRKGYLGKVISVADTRRTVQVMSDIWEEWQERTVTVWSDMQGKALTFVSDNWTVGHPAQASAYEVDATPEVVAKYRRWVATVSLPEQATRAAEARRKELEEALDRKREEALYGLRKGNTYEVVRGRKYPHGTMGVLLWHGENRFGPTAMLATTDRKDAKGRYADVIFINPANLKVADNDALKAELKRIADERANIPAEVDQTYRAVLNERLTATAKEWGVSVEVVTRRAVEVAKEESARLRSRVNEIDSVLSYADGSNFDRDVKTCESLSQQANAYDRLTAALA